MKAYVDGVIASGGKYIKAVIDAPAIIGGELMDQSLLGEIVSYSHQKGVKVAAHATTIAAYKMAVACDVDILIHIPLGEDFPAELAQEIAEKQIQVITTLVMMKGFADSPFYGYKKEDYNAAKEGVNLLKSNGVPILTGTDSNSTFFLPRVKHGSSLHKEMKLLAEAGLTPQQVLQSTTAVVASAFELENAGTITAGQKAAMILIKGRPDQEIGDIDKIVQIWIDGKPVLENSSYAK
ncbi:amidohydrolase family protein [Lachnoclostridium edouardi]|uniref:amidohydrolase family protein n=1 Tax=Lachnoclostridium edouardi TaxID=1926283 RepID=UPI002E8DCE48|nr:amidohydrolase family protein [Lachnoclostridium edouardi]